MYRLVCAMETGCSVEKAQQVQLSRKSFSEMQDVHTTYCVQLVAAYTRVVNLKFLLGSLELYRALQQILMAKLARIDQTSHVAGRFITQASVIVPLVLNSPTSSEINENKTGSYFHYWHWARRFQRGIDIWTRY